MNDNSKIAKELHRGIRKNFKRRSILCNHKNEIFGIDLCEMDHESNNYKYILTVIDVYTRFCYAVPLPNKSGTTVTTALKMILEEWEDVPEFIWCDQGKEFYNSHFKEYLSRNRIKMYSTYSELKCSIIERLNRTLKTKMEKVITENTLSHITSEWDKILIDIVYEYNYEDIHSFHKMTPYDATLDENQEKLKKIWTGVFIESMPVSIKHSKFKIGDFVRIYKYKSQFEKGYKSNFTNEIFRIHSIKATNPITYTIIDKQNEIIEGTFYSEEMTRTAFSF